MAQTNRLTSTNKFDFTEFSLRQKQVLLWWTEDSPYKDYSGIIADGSIRSGKTVSMSLSFVMWATSCFDNQNFAICGKTVNSVRRNVVGTLKQMLAGLCYAVDDSRSENVLTISRDGHSNRFYLFGGRDERSQDLVQGITLAGVLLDEVALMPQSFVNQATGRCSVAGSKWWFNCNPAERLHWFKVDWINQYIKKKLLYIHFTMDDNLSLSEEIKERYKNAYIGVFYRRYIEGLWCAAEGVIYGDAWDNDENTFVYDPEHPPWRERSTRRFVAVDYGTTNPTVFLDSYDDGDTYWVAREYYQDSRKEQRQLTPSQHADAMDEFLRGDKTPVIIIDPAAEAFRVELRNRGYRVKPANNEVLEGIRVTATLMRKRKLKISKECYGFLGEVESYVWDEKAALRGEEKPLKEKDHCLSGDTLVDTLTGQKPIRDLVGKIGIVRCYNAKRKRRSFSLFWNVRKVVDHEPLYRLTTTDGRQIKATADHKVLTSRGWVEMKDIIPGDEVVDQSSRSTSTPRQKRAPGHAVVSLVERVHDEPVYDMSVVKHHNLSVNGGLIVHNCMDAIRYLVNTTINRGRLMQ